ncbi:hypothetical protein [Sutcliffiella horikoshii]|uniref:Uncharacterized protein n=1 Tax=Sutcliffiella horikoshii TaxID=79883 RepID=A0A5D4TBY4_9BACI|nr:hypothetical protein [Sutcliffiella horikoshii]TYS72401.1 hypothetical protein FZC75_10650 [Sutcliffiella horikoshii]
MKEGVMDVADFKLTTVSFLPGREDQIQEGQDYYIYVKEPKDDYSSAPRSSFFDALELSKEETTKSGNWRCISTSSNQSVELHFRSYEDKRIISVTINLPSYQLDISSYAWYRQRKAFLKLECPEQVCQKLVEGLLQRIFVKYNGKTAYLSLKQSKHGVTSKNRI